MDYNPESLTKSETLLESYSDPDAESFTNQIEIADGIIDEIIETSDKKCGEIFVHENNDDPDTFSFSCVFCNQITFTEISDFFQHFKDYHTSSYVFSRKFDMMIETNDDVNENDEMIFKVESYPEEDSGKEENEEEFVNYKSKIASLDSDENDEDSSLDIISETLQLQEDCVQEEIVDVKENNIFFCEKCDRKYSSKKALQRHEKLIHKIMSADIENNKFFFCKICNGKFRTKHLVERHKVHDHKSLDPLSQNVDYDDDDDGSSNEKDKEKNEQKKAYHCEICGAVYLSKFYAQEHAKRIHPTEDKNIIKINDLVQCIVCNKSFKNEEHLLNHTEFDHPITDTFEKNDDSEQEEKGHLNVSDENTTSSRTANETEYSDPMKCRYCGLCYQGKDKRIRMEHERIHTDLKPYKCGFCDKSFTSFRYRNKHEQIHKGIRPFKCEMCTLSFIDKSTLKQHLQIHVGEKKFPCSYCGKLFLRNTDKRLHERIHTGEKPFQCTTCGKCFPRNDQLTKHALVHTALKPYKCKYCGKCFRTSSRIRNHERSHLGIKPHKCEICNAQFTEKSNLTQHIRRHTGDKRYPCQYCGKLFVQNTERKIHERVHSGENSFHCISCSKCFTSNEDLLKHQLKHKSDEFKCDICKKNFASKHSLLRHTLLHSGVRPYSCDICDAKFHHKYYLKSHKQIHLEVGEYVCKICGKDFKQKPNLYSHLSIVHQNQI